MSEYIKHTWVNGEDISAEKLNNMETGIVEAKKAGEGHGVALDNHNKGSDSHPDIRKILQDLATQIETLLNTDESTLAEMQEVIDYINSNKDLIEEISTGKVNVSDIVDNLVTNVANKPLSAAQGVVLKALIDAQQTAVDNAATTAQNNLSSHNTNTGAHADLRLEVKALADRINAALDSDDTTLDELSEIVAYIKSNKALIDAITTSKVSVADIVDDLVTNVKNKPLSAAQGVVLKALIDALTNTVSGKAPASHASASTTYGAGSGSNYGHVKLSDSTSGTSNANGGVAATPAAVKALADLIAKYLPLAGGTMTGDYFHTKNGYGRVYTSEGMFQVESWTQAGDETNRRLLSLYNAGAKASLAEALLLVDRVNSENSYYALYGEHNKPTPSAIGAAAATHDHGAAQITSGVFSATNIKAKAGTDYTYERLRNMSLNNADTNPSENGAIAWTYK